MKYRSLARKFTLGTGILAVLFLTSCSYDRMVYKVSVTGADCSGEEDVIQTLESPTEETSFGNLPQSFEQMMSFSTEDESHLGCGYGEIELGGIGAPIDATALTDGTLTGKAQLLRVEVEDSYDEEFQAFIFVADDSQQILQECPLAFGATEYDQKGEVPETSIETLTIEVYRETKIDEEEKSSPVASGTCTVVPTDSTSLLKSAFGLD